jgi:hypothetical protein
LLYFAAVLEWSPEESRHAVGTGRVRPLDAPAGVVLVSDRQEVQPLFDGIVGIVPTSPNRPPTFLSFTAESGFPLRAGAM